MPRTKEAFRQIRDERREQIMNASAAVFASKGLANTKTEDLAEAAGVSQGLLYRYFADKEAIFIALLERAVSGTIGRAEDSLNCPGTPLDKLRWLTEQYLQGMSNDPVHFQLFSQALALSGRIHDTVVKLEALLSLLRQLVVEGQASGEIARRDPDQLVLLYLSCIFGLAAGVGLRSELLTEHFPDAASVLRILQP